MPLMKPTSVLLASLLLLVAKPSTILQVHGLVCTQLETETLSSLYKILSQSEKTARLCPFTIQGDGCDETEPFTLRGQSKTVKCDSNFSIGGRCRINCNIDSHFIVKSGKELKLDSIVMEGAKMGSVIVENGGSLRSHSSTWRNNENRSTETGRMGGGAIHAKGRTFIMLLACEFWNNFAPSHGGAIYSNGTGSGSSPALYSIMNTFVENEADYGAGIYASSIRVLSHQSVFASNRAHYGPVIYLDRFSTFSTLQSKKDLACDNLDIISHDGECNGIYYEESDKCEEFDICNSPTQMPSSSPSASSMPTVQPTVTQSSSPSLSSMPSVSPSMQHSVSPSEEPSKSPTQTPTVSPSIHPSSVPTPLASESPSISPSTFPTSFPSVRPTVIPSEPPSTRASQSPTLTSSKRPSLRPSKGPSLKPTVSHSDTPSRSSGEPSYLLSL